MSATKHHKLIILGSGPAGYTAAIYAARGNLNPVVITGMEQGGQLMKTSKIANWPGDYEDVSGSELMGRMLKQVERFNAEIIMDQIYKVDFKQRPFRLFGNLDEYTCDALIIATGISAKHTGLPSEQTYLGRGVSTCATCDGFFYRDKKIAVIGGGNEAMEDALYLSKLASHVTIVHRFEKFQHETARFKQALELAKTGNITIEWNHTLEEILGNNSGVTSMKIKHTKTNASKEIGVDGIFLAIGHEPNSRIFEGQLDMKDGYICTQKKMEGNAVATNIEGVFAAGDVIDPRYRQAVVAAGSGCMAALDAKKYLMSR